MIMKQFSSFLLIALIAFTGNSCKKFLDVKPIDKLTGNNFYKSKDDVEAVINNFSLIFYNKINETHLAGTIGEFRAGEVLHDLNSTQNPFARAFIEVLGKNDLNGLLYNNKPWNRDDGANYHFERITDWRGYYEIIQGAGILIDKLNAGIPNISEVEKQQYIGAAVFARCYAYFVIVRLFGDVPYYAEGYHSSPLPREPMVSVITKCIADMEGLKDKMPWNYSDPAFRGVKATRGSAVALLMNMYMWNAGFDRINAAKYYKKTADLGAELVESNAYRLVPLDQWATVIKGRSEESLFEIFRTVNYGELNNGIAPIADLFIHYPYKRPFFLWELSLAYYKAAYMLKLYPDGVEDKRKEVWYKNMYANNGNFMLLKYAQNSFISGEESINPDNTFLIFRYAESILLRAEALAELGQDDESIRMLNLVRARAQASPYIGAGGQVLKDFIFMERSRELVGEGHHFFDLIRTKRILNPLWTYNPITLDQFNRGGWTWPISNNALNNNPYMMLNMYWPNGGK